MYPETPLILFGCSDNLRTWKEAFPDPANSPTYYTHTLTVHCVCIAVADAEEGGWIRAFSNVVRLRAWNGTRISRFTCLPQLFTPLNLHSQSRPFSPSFVPYPVLRTWTYREPPTLPPLIKSLLFSPAGGTERSAHQLLDLLNGICLRKFSSTWYYEKELPWIMKLIEACTGTLEHIKVMNDIDETCSKLRSFSLRYGVNS